MFHELIFIYLWFYFFSVFVPESKSNRRSSFAVFVSAKYNASFMASNRRNWIKLLLYFCVVDCSVCFCNGDYDHAYIRYPCKPFCAKYSWHSFHVSCFMIVILISFILWIWNDNHIHCISVEYNILCKMI